VQQTFILLLIASVIGAVQSQTWTGSYTADSSCNTLICCCMSGQVVVTSSSTNVYSVTSGASSLCSATSLTGTFYASGYTGWVVVLGNNVTFTLSSDSHTITVTNPAAPACGGKGVKSGAIKQHTNIIMLLAIGLVGVMMNTSKMWITFASKLSSISTFVLSSFSIYSWIKYLSFWSSLYMRR
jgi:hypothetical protein